MTNSTTKYFDKCSMVEQELKIIRKIQQLRKIHDFLHSKARMVT